MTEQPADPDEPRFVILQLHLEAALLPGWFEEVKRIAARHVRRMAVIEKPDEWVVRCEVPEDGKDAFREALEAAWADYDKGAPSDDAGDDGLPDA